MNKQNASDKLKTTDKNNASDRLKTTDKKTTSDKLKTADKKNKTGKPKTWDKNKSGKKAFSQSNGFHMSGNVQKNSKAQIITDWFYMSAAEVHAKGICDLLKANGYNEVELWEEMNILQIETMGNKCIDFEPVTYSWKDPADAAFIKDRNINTIFAVTVEESLDSFQPLLKLIINEWGGFLCADSPDFKPLYDLSNL